MTTDERLQAIEDRFAILDLKGRYAENADLKYTDDHRRKSQAEVDEIAMLQAAAFTEDATWDGGPQFGVSVGRKAIYESLRSATWSFAVHYFTPLHISVRGDEATGTWSLWQVGTLAKTQDAVFLAAMTRDRYVRTAEGWRISHMALTLRFLTPYNESWSRRRNEPYKV